MLFKPTCTYVHHVNLSDRVFKICGLLKFKGDICIKKDDNPVLLLLARFCMVYITLPLTFKPDIWLALSKMIYFIKSVFKTPVFSLDFLHPAITETQEGEG